MSYPVSHPSTTYEKWEQRTNEEIEIRNRGDGKEGTARQRGQRRAEKYGGQGGPDGVGWYERDEEELQNYNRRDYSSFLAVTSPPPPKFSKVESNTVSCYFGSIIHWLEVRCGFKMSRHVEQCIVSDPNIHLGEVRTSVHNGALMVRWKNVGRGGEWMTEFPSGRCGHGSWGILWMEWEGAGRMQCQDGAERRIGGKLIMNNFDTDSVGRPDDVIEEGGCHAPPPSDMMT